MKTNVATRSCCSRSRGRRCRIRCHPDNDTGFPPCSERRIDLMAGDEHRPEGALHARGEPRAVDDIRRALRHAAAAGTRPRAENARLSTEALALLRSVGGLTPSPAKVDRQLRLMPEFSTPLTEGEEPGQGVWIRHATFVNPEQVDDLSAAHVARPGAAGARNACRASRHAGSPRHCLNERKRR